MKHFKTMAITLLLYVVITATSQAQVVEKKILTLDGAKKVIAAVVAEAKAKNAPGGTIAVVDDGGNLVALERLDNTFAASANIAIGKARTAAMFRRSTRIFEDIINKGRTTMVTLPDFTPLQGGVPIEFEGNIIGAVGVSGAASAQQDEELALVGANSLKSPEMSTSETSPSSNGSSEVTYIESQKVAEGFARGAVLVGNEEQMMYASRNYMVHASRREASGMAEIHELDTDIIYVLEGSATFVTGGMAVDAKLTAANELRGAAIQDGQIHHLSKGDIIIVPNGTPHWFKEVQGPLLYYVVKVR